MTRRLVRHVLAGVNSAVEAVSDAELATSELATNASVYGQAPFEPRLRLAAQALVREVFDTAPTLPTIPGAPATKTSPAGLDVGEARLQEGGRGLALVCHLAAGRIGAHHATSYTTCAPVTGKVIWSTIQLPSPPRPPQPDDRERSTQ